LQKESGFTAEVKAKAEYHKFLIGRGGANIKKVRDSTGARVIFPSPNDADQQLIVIIGKKDSVDKAKAEIEGLVRNLVSVVLNDAVFVFCRLFFTFWSFGPNFVSSDFQSNPRQLVAC
jgi:hypothetical protein